MCRAVQNAEMHIPFPAIGANPEIFQPVTGDFESPQFSGPGRRQAGVGGVDVVHPVAFGAPHVIMLFQVSVETGFDPGEFHLADHAVFMQDFQVAVNGAQTDAGQPLPDCRVEICGGRVRSHLTKFLQDHPSLGRIATKFSGGHDLVLPSSGASMGRLGPARLKEAQFNRNDS